MGADITSELAAALQNVLEQTHQMQGMFGDADHTIANAVADAEYALGRYMKWRQTSKSKVSPTSPKSLRHP